jgi:hypothetical protein
MGLSAPDITTVSNPKINPANAAVKDIPNSPLPADEMPAEAMLVCIHVF